MTRALLVAAALFAIGCHEGNTLENQGTGTISSTDVDMAKGGTHTSSPDLAPAPVDMVEAQTCGTVVACGISCLGGLASSSSDMAGGGLLGGDPVATAHD